MLVFNQQANIKNVNGAIADVFANRPAPQSTFYIFYSIDTQEIYYDNGIWVLIGTGGGGVNIYNSDGTLTGPRDVFCSQHNLRFREVRLIRFDDLSFADSFIIDFSGGNEKIYTRFNNNDIGLKLDFANDSFYLGDSSINNNVYYNSSNGDFEVTYNGGSIYRGSGANGNFQIGNNNIVNTIVIDSDNFNKRLITFYNNLANGLYLDFQNDTFQLGKQTGGNLTYIEVWDSQNLIRFKNGGIVNGLECDYNTNEFKIGDVNGQFNNNQIKVNDQTNFIELGKPGKTLLQIDNDTLDILKTVYNGVDSGLKLDFANGLFLFGETLGSGAFLEINNTTGNVTLQNSLGVTFLNNNGGGGATFLGDVNGIQNGTLLTIDYFANQIIKTSNQGNDIGLKLDFANNEYELGDVANQFSYYLDLNNRSFIIGDRNGNFNSTTFELNDTAQVTQTLGGGGINGLYINYNTSLYKYGQMTGGNGTTIEIDDVATYPVQIYGTNVLSGSSGSSSGQHLKIKINGVDYKIELKNP